MHPRVPFVLAVGRSVEDDDALLVLAVVHVLVALRDLVQLVGLGDELVELQHAAAVQLAPAGGCPSSGSTRRTATPGCASGTT